MAATQAVDQDPITEGTILHLRQGRETGDRTIGVTIPHLRQGKGIAPALANANQNHGVNNPAGKVANANQNYGVNNSAGKVANANPHLMQHQNGANFSQVSTPRAHGIPVGPFVLSLTGCALSYS